MAGQGAQAVGLLSALKTPGSQIYAIHLEELAPQAASYGINLTYWLGTEYADIVAEELIIAIVFAPNGTNARMDVFVKPKGGKPLYGAFEQAAGMPSTNMNGQILVNVQDNYGKKNNLITTAQSSAYSATATGSVTLNIVLDGQYPLATGASFRVVSAAGTTTAGLR